MKHVSRALVFAIGIVLLGWTSTQAASPLPTGRWLNSFHAAIGSPPLPNNASISTVAVDGQDRVWIGTFAHGIAMFDGYTWTRYTTADGLVDNNVLRITAVGGAIWIATEKGVSLFAPAGNSWTNYTAAGTSPNGLPNDYVNAVAQRTTSNQIIGMTSTLFATPGFGVASCQLVFPDDLNCSIFTQANTNNGLPSDFVYDMEQAANGDVWFAAGLGVSRLATDNTWTAFTTADNTPGCPKISDASDIAVDHVRNRVWVGLANGVTGINGRPGEGACMYDVATDTWFHFHAGNSGLMDNTVLDVAVDSEGRAWLATSPYGAANPGGVYVCTWVEGPNPEDNTCYWESYDTGDGLGSIRVNAVAAGLDRVWFGTQDAAVSSYALRWARVEDEAQVLATLPDVLYAGSASGLKRFDYESSTWSPLLTDIDVTAILAQGFDDIWVATAASGLHHWDGTDWQTMNQQNSPLAGNHLLALARDGLGRIWIATGDAGVNVYDPVADAWAHFDTSSTLPSNRVQSLMGDAAGGMWVGTDSGLVLYTGATWESVDAESLPASDIRALLLDAGGNLWAGTPAGAARHIGGIWTVFDIANGMLPDNTVSTIVAGAGNHVWIATQGGVTRFDGMSRQSYRRLNSGLDNERVAALAVDDRGNLWASGPAYSQSNVDVPAGILLRYGGDEPLGQPAPSIAGFTPATALADAMVTITGNFFTPGSWVEFAGKQGNVQVNPISISGGAIQVRVPPTAVFGKLRVRNTTGTATSSTDFSPLPQITEIVQGTGVVGSEVTIIGLNLAAPGFTEVRFGSGSFSSLHVLENTPQLLRVRVPADATTGPIEVRTPAGTAVSDKHYTVSPNGLVIFGYEVHQGLPQYPLVAGKTTVVRVFLGTSNPAGICAYADRGVLQVLRVGENTPKAYLANLANGGVINSGEFCNRSKDVTKSGSMDFIVPGSDLDSGVGYFMGIGLSVGFINVGTRELGQHFFARTHDIRVHASIPGWLNNQQQATQLNRTMTTQYRTFPVRDGWGLIGEPSGFRMVLRDYPVCDGTPSAHCGAGELWDFWQENPNGQLIACTIVSSLDNATDDGSRLTYTFDGMAAGQVETRTFYARLRPGQSLPNDPLTLLNINTSPNGVTATATRNVNLGSLRCGAVTDPGIIAYSVRVTNTSNSTVNARVVVDYNEAVLALYAAGGIMVASGDTFRTRLVPGNFWAGGGWLPERHSPPMDRNYNGVIDGSDLAFYMVEGEIIDPATGRFVLTTDPNAIRPGDLIRHFADTNRNNRHDSGEPKARSVQQGENNGQFLLWNIPHAYMAEYNATASQKTDFSALLFMPGINPFMGPGQGRCGTTKGRCTHPGYQFWTNVDDSSVFGQELGHAFGMVHGESPNNDGGTHSIRPRITNVPAGYDTLGRRVILGPDMASIMWANPQTPDFDPNRSQRDSFFEPFEYHQAYTYLRKRATQQASVAEIRQEDAFFMVGTVSGDHDITINYTNVLAGQIPSDEDPFSEFVLRFKQGSSTLSEHRFPVKFDAFNSDHHDEVVDAPVGIFAVTVPYPPATERIEIWHGPHPLVTRSVSAGAPTVQVASPNGGESIPAEGTFTVRWQGDDPDGDSLYYTVRYSPDNGASWITLAAAVTGDRLDLPALSIPGSSEALVEVVATDGFNSGSDRSDGVFQVGNKPPVGASILNPPDGTTIVYGRPVYLVGTAFDLEDGVLDGSSLTWASNRAGNLGSGNGITATLTTGVHLLTLFAADSDSNVVTATSQITIAADFDRDGIPDEYEMQTPGLNWWDPTDAGLDLDGDGLTARAEFELGTDPNNPDTDGDGVNDGDELAAGTSPLDSNSKPSGVQLLTSRHSLIYDVIVGAAPLEDAFLLMSSTPQTLTWSATENAPWLTIVPSAGETTGEIELTIDPTGLGPGVYSGELRITVEGAPERTLPLQLTVQKPLTTDSIRFVPALQR